MRKVSAIQMTSNQSVEENLIQAEKLIKSAAEEGAQLLVLPEMFPIIGLSSLLNKADIYENFGHGHIQNFLAKQAKKYQLWIVGGTIPIKGKNPEKAASASLVFDDKGEIVARYDKVHLFDVMISETESYQESATIEPGSGLAVVETPLGKLGLSVCYDIRFPELYRHLFNLGAEIFTIPAAFTVKTGQAHWELLARSRAVENFCYVIGACQTGTHSNGRKTYGHSLIVNPWGEVIAKQEEGIGVITAEIDLRELNKIRSNMPVAAHQKIFFDLSRMN
jgi:nitrilase